MDPLLVFDLCLLCQLLRDSLILNLTHVLQEEMKLEIEILPLFRKIMKKLCDYLYKISSDEITSAPPRLTEVS